MSPIVVLDNEYITLQYLPEHQIIYHVVHKPIGDEPLREALNAGTNTLKQYGACKWLSDDRKNGPLSQEVRDWGFQEWAPRTIGCGWKYWANVVPTDLLAAGTLAPVIEAYYGLGLRMMVFSDVETAIQWLDGLKG